MSKYYFDVKVAVPGGGVQTERVYTENANSAARQAELRTGGRLVSNGTLKLDDTESKSSSSSMSMPNIGGSGALVGLLAVLVFAVWALPWVMAIGGAFGGAWISGKMFGTGLGRAMEENKVKLVSCILIVSTLLGATGYIKGYEWKQQLNSDPTPE